MKSKKIEDEIEYTYEADLSEKFLDILFFILINIIAFPMMYLACFFIISDGFVIGGIAMAFMISIYPMLIIFSKINEIKSRKKQSLVFTKQTRKRGDKKMPRIFRWIFYFMILSLLWKVVDNIEQIINFLITSIK